jgi:hypothetical protein
MRKALNSNPLVQVGAIALLGVIVAFLMLTRLKGDEPPPAEPAPGADVASIAGAAPVAGTDIAPDASAAPTDPATPGAAASSAGEFTAGPGLPDEVVKAYEGGDSVVVLITRQGAIDGKKLRAIAERLRGDGNVSLFHAYARDVAEYSRITQGVELDRVPALIVLSPKEVSGDGPPVATLSYGFRGYESVRQAVDDAAYEGKELSYHP